MRRYMLLLIGLIATIPVAANAVGPTTDAASYDLKIAAATASMQVKPLDAARLAREAGALAKTAPTMPNRSLAVATAMWLEGEAAMRVNDSDVGGPLIRGALEITARDVPGTKLHGDLLLSFARLQSQRGHPEEALAASQSAFELFHKLDLARSEAVALQSIGTVYQYADDFDKVLYYYNLAEETYPGDLSLGLTSSNNRANAFRELGRLPDAILEYRRALAIANRLNSPVLASRVLANLASAQIAANDLVGASASLAKGFVIAARPGNAGWRGTLLAASANLALREGRFRDAATLAERTFAEIGSEQRSQQYKSLQGTAYQAYKALGDYRAALIHHEVYVDLEKQNQSAAASATAKLTSAKFDFANQNERIATLQSDKLKRDIALTRLNARQQEVILSALLALATAAALFLFVYVRLMRLSRTRLQASNAALQVANVDLEKALTAKSLFLATTSHEIRTPLNGVLGMAQVILADAGVGGRVRDQVRLIEGAGNTMKALVDDILDIAKMDSGEYEVILVPADPTALLTEVVNFWETQALRKNLEISLNTTGLPPMIATDPTRLRQVFFNLVSNAIKFTLAGSIGLAARVEQHRDAEFLVVDVSDTGIGIPPKSFEVIFDKFHQLDQGTARQFGGSGLGLAISRNIARALGGDITVTSTPDIGTTFTVRLPFERTSVTSQLSANDGRSSAQTLATCRVLVAGANAISASVLCAVLKPHVGTALACADLDTIPTVATRDAIDVVILDGDAMRTAGRNPVEDAQCLQTALRSTATTLLLLITPPVEPCATNTLAMILRPIGPPALIAQLETLFRLENKRYSAAEEVAATEQTNLMVSACCEFEGNAR